jgi:antitoxin component HigA of HigAB toxin-antitoxin module
MMYSQGLKRVIAARSTVAQLLLGNRAVTIGLVNQNLQSFSLYNAEMVSENHMIGKEANNEL